MNVSNRFQKGPLVKKMHTNVVYLAQLVLKRVSIGTCTAVQFKATDITYVHCLITHIRMLGILPLESIQLNTFSLLFKCSCLSGVIAAALPTSYSTYIHVAI